MMQVSASETAERLLSIVRRGYEEGWNQGRLTALDEILAPDFRAHDPSAPAGVFGRAEVGAVLQAIRTGFPDVRREVRDYVAAGDKIAVLWRVTGTHHGPFNGTPPTGRAIDITGITLYRFAGEQIAEEWVAMDNLSLFRQLGLA